MCCWYFNVNLQAKKAGGGGGTKEAEQAEVLLLTNKPFTDVTSILTQLVRFSISFFLILFLFFLSSSMMTTMSQNLRWNVCPCWLSCLVANTDTPSLSTTQYALLPQSLLTDCVLFQEYYSTALKKADAKKQKVILRIIKRMVHFTTQSLPHTLITLLWTSRSAQKSHTLTRWSCKGRSLPQRLRLWCSLQGTPLMFFCVKWIYLIVTH